MHMTKRLLCLNHFACHLFPNLPLLLVILVSILLSGETVYASHNYSCDSNRLLLWNVDDNQIGRTYTISGSCKDSFISDWGEKFNSVKNWTVDITAIWNKTDRTGTEVVISEYGQLIRNFQCDYDPWLEPASTCTMTSHNVIKGTNIVANKAWWPGYEDMNFRQNFPTSALALDQDKRRELVSQAMTRTLKIIDPVENQSFASPDLMVTAVMERPVINPPDYAVAIKVENAWPEPGVPPKKYEEGKKYLKTANQLITYFNMKGKDLWGAQWGVSAHVVSNEPGWTQVTYFTVNALVADGLGSTLSEPILSEPAVYELNPPQIHNPRKNHTYNAEGGIPLKITYDPEAELTVLLSYKPVGGGQKPHQPFYSAHFTPEETEHPGMVDKLLGAPVLFAGAEVVEVLVDAIIEKQHDGVKVKSKHSYVGTRVLVPKIEISKPDENKQYTAPAEVNLIIVKPYGWNSYGWDIDMEVKFDKYGGFGPLSGDFVTYTDNSYVVSEVFNTLVIKYQLKTPGKYRFRARFTTPEASNTPGKATHWTDWRQIEIIEKIKMTRTPISPIEKPVSAMKKVEGQQIKPETSAEQLRPQYDKISPTVTAKKPAFKLKTAPVFVQPQNLQEIARRGSVGFKVKGIEDKDQLDWQIEYKKFGTSKYNRMRMAKPLVVSGNNQVTGSFHASQEGYYRIRVRSKEMGSPWSTWRLFRVGKPKVKTNEERSLKSTVKKPVAEDGLTPKVAPPEQKEPKTIKPINKNQKLEIKEPAGQGRMPRIINNS